ncbi:MAG TPA: FAD-dependent monooxygenase, partial [Rhizomicrobium sp.]
MSPTVLISGAGIAGPTLAWWLTRYGFRCTLVERAPAPRQGGYVIDFWGKGYDIAEKMGLAPQLERDGYHVKEVRLLDHEGHRAGGFGVEVFSRLTGGRYVTLPRSALARMVWNAVSSDCETLFDDSVSALDQDE